MRVDTTELMAASDIADLLSVVPGAITNWRGRYEDFPQPIVRVARGHTPLWRVGDITAWYRRRIAANDETVVNPKLIQLLQEES